MKRILTVLLAAILALSLAMSFTACSKSEKPAEEETTAATETEDTTAAAEEEETTEDANFPKAGETVDIGGVKVKIPDGWTVASYSEGQNIELEPADAFMSSVEIINHMSYGDEHAKEWADNINGNYGGDKEIDKVKIGGKEFYRVKADSEQNVCFADLSDEYYVEISVMFMPWEDGAPVLDNISF